MRRAWKSRRKPGRLEDKTPPAAFSEGNAIGSPTPRSRNPCSASLFRSGGALLEKSLVQRLLATYLFRRIMRARVPPHAGAVRIHPGLLRQEPGPGAATAADQAITRNGRDWHQGGS